VIRLAALLLLAAPAAAEVYRLSPEAAAAARTAGEARAYEQLAADDAARRAKRREGGFLGLGIGAGALPPQGYSPLGDVGQSGFVFPQGSIGDRRYRN
jgi:hypothetical protein